MLQKQNPTTANMDQKDPNPFKTYWVSTTESTEFTHLSWALTHSSLIALDAEWKPQHHTHTPTPHRTDPTFPTVSLLQLACRLTDSPPDSSESTHPNSDDSAVFLVDLLSIPLGSIYEKLKEMFVSKDALKLGFRFKQDLIFLSYTFFSNGFDSGFDRVEPFIDISSIYLHMQQSKPGRRISKNTKSLAAICEELLGKSLSKELQCSDWSLRPLTEEQKTYAAMDAYCLLKIFSIFQRKVDNVGSSQDDNGDLQCSNFNGESEKGVEKTTPGMTIVSSNISEASTSTDAFEFTKSEAVLDVVVSKSLCNEAVCLDESLSKIVCKYGSEVLLKESDMKPKASKKKGNKQRTMGKNSKPKDIECATDWQGRFLWELTNGGDGCPKFLCDAMIEGLAKRLRCVGIDAAVPHSKKPESRDLIEQARKEKRVLLTRDAKLLRHEYLIGNKIYRVESLNKDDQLKEVIETFQLTVSEDQLMSRCTKCNGRFIQKPLTTEEAVEAGKGFQKIPNCLFNQNLEFWQCIDCKQLYWEGTQYHNAIQNLSMFITRDRNSKEDTH